MIFQGETTFGSIIESLTSGIYDGNSNCIREYIQNAIDSGSKKIKINYQNNNDDIVIRDYGGGMDKDELTNALTLGGSNKSGSQIGWRGIGIYSGVPNFKKIVITTRKDGDKKLSVEIDSEYIRMEYLKPIQAPVKEILEGGTSDLVEQDDDEFEPGTQISLMNIESNQTALFEPQRLKSKLIRVLPLPLHENSIFKDKIINFLKTKNIMEPDFEIFFNNEKLYRPPTDDSIFDPQSFISGFYKAGDGTDLFAFWAITSKHNKEIEPKKPDYERKNRGIVFKLKGMTIGDERSPEITVSNLYQGNYSFWNYGEIHILDPKIRENAGRNNFESLTGHSVELFKEVGRLVGDIQKNNRQKSSFDKSSKIEDIENKVKSGSKSKTEAIKELENIKKSIDHKSSGTDNKFLEPYNTIIEERRKDELNRIDVLLKYTFNATENDTKKDVKAMFNQLPENIRVPILKKIKDPSKKLTENLFSGIEDALSRLTKTKKEEFNKLVSEVFAIDGPGNKSKIRDKAKIFILDPEKLLQDSPNDSNNQNYTYLVNANFGQVLLAFYQIFVNGEKHHSKTFKEEWYDRMGTDKDLFLFELGCTIDLLLKIIKLSKPRDKLGSLP